MRGGLRPCFPPGTPEGYVALAQHCWAADPSQRPRFHEIIPTLDAILAATAAKQQPQPGPRAASDGGGAGEAA
jgi:hypothetical protein